MSGTTGFPKGAILHHHGLVQNAIDVMRRANIGAGDVFVNNMPLFHTTGCAILALGGLGVGATMLLAPVFDADVIIRVIAREKSEFIFGVPTMLVALNDAAENAGIKTPSVKSILSGGAMVAPELCKRTKNCSGRRCRFCMAKRKVHRSSPSAGLTIVWRI